MADEGFKIGDVVRLRSNGPRMTVTYYGASAMTGEVTVACAWFDGNKKVEDSFPPGALERLEE